MAASAEGLTHPLTLKVMRVSRPEIANAWQPFFSSSPSYSAHSTASILSLQGATPLPSHPKTLRDLTHASEVLLLPSSFGSIQLGETFSCCLCMNNETPLDIAGVHLRVEMQTASTKVLLTEFGGDNHTLEGMDSMQCVVHHEVKELGQHVLGCTISYHTNGGATTGSQDPEWQTFRKYYKFPVTNPLSVKTKVHTPISPSSIHHRSERDKIFLEVHIQNLTVNGMYFDKIRFIPTEDWILIAASTFEATPSGTWSLMQPQDVRQYIYILSPQRSSSTPPSDVAVGLGRLDLAWRSSFGEPGRLLTSTLSRKILAPMRAQPAPALPPHIKRPTNMLAPSRSQSPGLSRPNTPPPRTESPARRQMSIDPVQLTMLPSDFDVHLIVSDIPQHIPVGRVFAIPLSLCVSSQSSEVNRYHTLMIQCPLASISKPPANPPSFPQFSSPRLSLSAVSTPTTATIPAPSSSIGMDSLSSLGVSKLASSTLIGDGPTRALPVPFLPAPRSSETTPRVTLHGPSAITTTIELQPQLIGENTGNTEQTRLSGVCNFELTFVPSKTGFHTIGPLRVVSMPETEPPDGNEDGRVLSQPLQLMGHWDRIGEVWVA